MTTRSDDDHDPNVDGACTEVTVCMVHFDLCHKTNLYSKANGTKTKVDDGHEQRWMTDMSLVMTVPLLR